MAVTVGQLELIPAFENISVYASFSDTDTPGTVLEYREVGTPTWKPGIPMTLDKNPWVGNPASGVANPFVNQARAVIFWLKPRTAYEVRVTWSSPSGVLGTNPVVGIVTTRDDDPPSNGLTYYVSEAGNDANPGTETQPFRTIQKAAGITNPGDKVLVMSGTYDEMVTISRSGIVSNYITFQSYDLNNKAVVVSTGLENNFRLYANYVRVKGFDMPTSPGGMNIMVSGGLNARGGIIEDNQISSYEGAIRLAGYQTLVQRNRITPPAVRVDNYGILYWGTLGGDVFRNNIIAGGQVKDGIGTAGSGATGGQVRDSFIYDNYIEGANDDIIEIEEWSVNCAVWGNMCKDGLMGIAISDIGIGPLYVFRNVFLDFWDAAVKMGSTSFGFGYFYHNTFYSEQNVPGPASFGYNAIVDNIVFRNNIMATREWGFYLSEWKSNNDFDYNLYTTERWHWGRSRTIPPESASITFETLAGLRTGQGFSWAGDPISIDVYSEIHGMVADPRFISPLVSAITRDYRLASNSPAIDKGVILPGFNDASSPWPYSGLAPDMGALEFDAGPAIEPQYLTILAAVGGTTNPVPGVYSYVPGGQAVVTAIPLSGYSFSHFLLDSQQVTYNPVQIVMDRNITIQAVFIPIQPGEFSVSITALEGGTTSPTPGTYIFIEGELITIAALPSTGFIFDHWEGDATGSNPSLSIQVTKNMSIIAVFASAPPLQDYFPALIGAVTVIMILNAITAKKGR